MKRIKIIGASAFLLALGIAAPVVARQEKPDKQEEKAKPQKQEEKGKAQKQEQQAKPERQQPEKSAKQEQQQAKSQQTQQTHQTQERKQQQDNSAKQQAGAGKQEQQAKPEKQQEAKSQQQSRTQQQAGDRQQQGGSARPPERTQEAKARQQSHRELRLSARGSGRIPEERFHSNFGREHNFRMQEPVLVGGYSRFQYGGYWFGFVEPWPADWYYTDDFYIDYVDGGYYMYDPYYPGTRFAISVVL
jgi:hypothetical protein